MTQLRLARSLLIAASVLVAATQCACAADETSFPCRSMTTARQPPEPASTARQNLSAMFLPGFRIDEVPGKFAPEVPLDVLYYHR